MPLSGLSLIGNSLGKPGGASFHAVNPSTGSDLPELFYTASSSEVNRAAELAGQAFDRYSRTSGAERAAFLRAIAEELEASRPQITERVPLETALPEGRANGELGRTIGQLRMFADLVENGSWVDARLESAQPDRAPVPKPDTRSMRIPIGPVAVFGASNFPLAFSVAGGDTASALAAGCPVVCVAHFAHPGVSELAGRAILRAVERAGMPEGTFSLLQGTGQDVGAPLVKHPAMKAVGFTGSRFGGLALTKIASERDEPIPVYAEMSSINPIVVLKGALRSRADALAAGLVGSVSMGVGQFCTNPGMILLPEGDEADAFAGNFAALMDDSKGGTTLHAGIARAYDSATSRIHSNSEVQTLSSTDNEVQNNRVNPWIFRTTASAVLADESLSQETFGPSSMLVTYNSEEELIDLIGGLEGQLTGTIQHDDTDLPLSSALISALRNRVGRMILNSYPTGVEVGNAMVHGGPFPATSDGRSTSVGTAAIERFTRAFCYQGFPEASLPDALKNGNPLGIWRTQDGELTRN